VLDTVAPSAPVLGSSPTSPSDDPTIGWTYSLTSGTAVCELVGPAGVVPGGTCSSTAATYDLTGLDDGDYELTVSAVDVAGNAASVVASVHVLDTAAPSTPVITSAPSSTGLPRVVEWRFTVEEGTPSCSLTGASGPVAGGSGCAGGVFAPSLAAGAAIGGKIASTIYNGPNVNLMVLLGMIGFLSGIMRTPFTAFVLVLEMTDRHSAIFPMMVTAVTATLVANGVEPKALYERVRDRFIDQLSSKYASSAGKAG
jgi:hypothetical protein